MISHDITYIKLKTIKFTICNQKCLCFTYLFFKKEKLNEIGLNLVDFDFDSELPRLIQNLYLF